MNSFISLGNVYYVGDQINETDIAVPDRPSPRHDWSFEDSEWVEHITEPTIQEQIATLEVQQTPRRIREAALGMQDSIDFLQDIEDQIAALRQRW